MSSETNAKELLCELCRHFYQQGWVSGTGGGISLREGDRVFMAPSGVQKERIQPEHVYELDTSGEVRKAPDGDFKLSACAPLFLHAFNLRGAGAVIHSHSVHAMLATLVEGDEFRVTHLEMMKGIRDHGYHDELVVPILENTAHECDLADALADAMVRYPKTQAVLVRRHGVYVWGRDWVEAKTHAECYDYLFEAAVKMRLLGFDPARAPEG
ncbi:MAG: methylthioribulose 1-phosphate dehydratase [Myxococcales bacterium]|nr:methylthioribulose 1-phosphate dehydratase [Myxococcales bacterium]